MTNALPESFQHLHFRDARQAAELLRPFADHGLSEALALALRATPDPQRALVRLSRFVDSPEPPGGAMAYLKSDTDALHMLAIIFSQSNFLGDLVLRQPALLPWLREEAVLDREMRHEELRAGILDGNEVLDSMEACGRALRRFRKRAILRIAVRDIYLGAPLPSVVRDLSNLADSSLQVAYECASHTLDARYGTPMPASGERAGFTILGMGKLGGRELNFSSDIDLLFIYSHEGETGGGTSGRVSNAEYFTKLGELIVKAISEQTADGLIFRVDMRLRPFGSSGPLAVGLDSALEYYADYGRAWERQAFIKARPCAGDLELGHRLLEKMRPFVYPKFFDDETLEEVRQVKALTEARLARGGKAGLEVKLGPGGIRDIEFTVQMLQLLNGGRFDDLRTTSTLEALEALGRHQCLTVFEADTLCGNYTFLRQVEHRLQIQDGSQCHALPSSPDALKDFARRLGFAGAEPFMEIYQSRTRETRAILEQFLASKGSGNLWVGDVLNPYSDGAEGMQRLGDLGFEDPQKAREALLNLACGAEGKPFTRYVHQQFSGIAPFLINALAHTGQPGENLSRLERVLSGIKAPATLYALLNESPVLVHFLVTLVWNSNYLANILVRDPSLFETLGNVDALDTPSTRRDLEHLLDALKQAYEPDAALYRLRDGEMLRVGMRDLCRNARVAQVGDELTQLAEVILQEVFEQAKDKTAARFGDAGLPFAVLGLGKLGGWEMGYGSDLDLLFVYDGEAEMQCPMAPTEYFAALASTMLNRLKEPTRHGQLYDVDARLRPDGSKGPLAVDHVGLGAYYREKAQPWERFALMKARFVAGNREFGIRVERLVKDIAFGMELSPELARHVEDLRVRLAQQASPGNLKKSNGGINEIEFLVRFWQLAHVGQIPELKRGDVFGALDMLDENGLTNPEESQTVREAYGVMRRILNRVRMKEGTTSASQPGEPSERTDLALRLGLPGSLEETVASQAERVHALYLEHLARITGG